MLYFDNVSTFYGKIQALHNVNVEVHKGEIVTLIGANGAGKSTLLMTLCGSPRAASGSIRYQGEELVGQDSSDIMRKSIAVVPEGRRIFARLTVEENLAMGGFFTDKGDYQEQLERVFAETRDAGKEPPSPTPDVTAGLDLPLAQQADPLTAPPRATAVDLSMLKRIGDSHVSPPPGFNVHPKLQPLLERRAGMINEGGIDWGFGELLALGTLLAMPVGRLKAVLGARALGAEELIVAVEAIHHRPGDVVGERGIQTGGEHGAHQSLWF